MSWQSIPEELKRLRQWVGALENKEPINPRTGKRADVTDANTWGTFDEACLCGTPHIGFVFTPDDPYVFIDLDTGKKPAMAKLHAEIVMAANSYTETSKSGNSSHIIVKGNIATGRRADNQGIEIYPHGRYALLTGWAYHGPEINEAQHLIDYLASLIDTKQVPTKELVSEQSGLTDEAVWERAAKAENGDKFLALFNGVWQDYPEYQGTTGPDHSRADLALCTFLDFYTKDVEQVIRLFKYSKLYRPGVKGRKSGDGSDYIRRTLTNARARNEADNPPVDFSALEERAREVLEQVAREEPDIRLDVATEGKLTLPPGIVGEIAQYIYTTATRPVPEVSLMAALAVTAGLVGRQYNISGSGLNLYLIILAPTGTGKEGAASGINMLISKARERVPSVDQFIGPAEFASGPGLIKSLAKQPSFFSIIGEIGLRVQQMADPRANAAEKTLQRALLNLYSKSGWHQIESGSAYSDSDKNAPTLYAPALTIFGDTVPENFFSALTDMHIRSGLLPRFSFLEYNGQRPPRNKVSAFCPPDPLLLDRFCDLAATVIQMQANNSCAPVILDSAAQKILDNFDSFADDRINQGTEVYKHLWNRAHLKALRLAAVIAVGVNWHNPIITADIAEWAVKFIKQDVHVIEMRFAKEEIGFGEHRFEAEIRKVVVQYLAMPKEKRKQYSVPASIIDQPVIPFNYLRRRLRQLQAFKEDRRGLARAIQEGLNDVTKAGILHLVPPLQRKEQYGLTADVYVLGDSW